MTYVRIDADNQIHVIHHPPIEERATFVFINSMGATTTAWEHKIAPSLRTMGYGTLSFDFRGQGESHYGANARLNPGEIGADILRVYAECAPDRPIMVGLSIGGLFAARAWLNGAAADGLVLINTLRKPGPLVEWVNTLEARLIALGGMPLVHDVLRPMLVSPERLAEIRASHLSADGYTPWPEDHPRRRLAENVHQADWNLPYEELDLPTLVLTGAHDRLFRVQEDVDELAARLPKASVVSFPDAGHALHMEHPDRFVALLDDFANRIAGD